MATNLVKASIKDVLLKKDRELSEEKLKKAVFKQVKEEYKDKEKDFQNRFATELNSLVCKNKILEKDGLYSIDKNKQGNNKRSSTSAELSDNGNTLKKEKSSDDASSWGEKYSELWKNGEKHWREGSFDQQYLLTNPDKITRLFCGNLSKRVTEEALKACIDGITHIKWITDKETGEFYGSSFIELKNSRCAATAALQDKTKFMGR